MTTPVATASTTRSRRSDPARGVRRRPEGETLEFYFNADAGHDAWVEAAARQVQENLGFDYKLQSTEWAQYLELLDAEEFTGPFRLGWSLDYPSPENYIRPIVGTGGDSNYTGYSNPEVDDLLVQGDEAATLEESFALLPAGWRRGPRGHADHPDVERWHRDRLL